MCIIHSKVSIATDKLGKEEGRKAFNCEKPCHLLPASSLISIVPLSSSPPMKHECEGRSIPLVEILAASIRVPILKSLGPTLRVALTTNSGHVKE